MRRPTGGLGVDIPPPVVLLESSGLGKFAARDQDMSELWERNLHQTSFAQPARPREPERHNIASEPDRRCFFVPSSVRYLSKEYDEMTQGAAASSSGPSSGSSLSAARSVLQENRAESIAFHERVVVEETVAPARVVQAQEQWARPCEGPGCNTRMSRKSEWTKYYRKYYCIRCYDANNLAPS